MCGRYTITVTMEELIAYYLTEQPSIPFHTPRYNVAPGQMIPAIVHDGERNRLGQLRWGLIPSWAKDAKFAYKMINARAETVQERPAFKTPFQRKRCLIPADGFFEWKKIGSGNKQPMRIILRSRQMFSFAGLYDTWLSPEGERINTCTIITTTPNELVASIHDRMPVILSRKDEAVWLDQEQSLDTLQSLLQPYPADDMHAYPVSKIVGNVKNDRKECIVEVPELD